jgi:hypothetical protein
LVAEELGYFAMTNPVIPREPTPEALEAALEVITDRPLSKYTVAIALDRFAEQRVAAYRRKWVDREATAIIHATDKEIAAQKVIEAARDWRGWVCTPGSFDDRIIEALAAYDRDQGDPGA